MCFLVGDRTPPPSRIGALYKTPHACLSLSLISTAMRLQTTLTPFIILSFSFSLVAAFPSLDSAALKRIASLAARDDNGNGGDEDGGGRLIQFPGPLADSGLKQIPDADHPFIAPGPNDQRGPCPGMNTLANHGYIPRNGVGTAEQILEGSMEAFNLGRDLAGFLVSFSTLSRGNSYLGLLSVGGESDQVPQLPGNIDDEVPGGLAKHNRFESDVSLTRNNLFLGDNRNFNPDLYDMLLQYVAKFGDDGPEGPKTIVTQKVFEEFKFDGFNRFQAIDPEMQYHAGRQLAAYLETAFVLHAFANGTTGNTSISGMTSFFAHQTFPPNFFRRSSPATLTALAPTVMDVRAAHPIPPGMNINGTYVNDPGNFSNFACATYEYQAGSQIPAALNSTTGTWKKNVDTMVEEMFKTFNVGSGCLNKTFPSGESGI